MGCSSRRWRASCQPALPAGRPCTALHAGCLPPLLPALPAVRARSPPIVHPSPTPPPCLRPAPLHSHQMTFAKKNGSIIVYDAAYALYISDPNCPKTIYEIPGGCTPEEGCSWGMGCTRRGECTCLDASVRVHAAPRLQLSLSSGMPTREFVCG